MTKASTPCRKPEKDHERFLQAKELMGSADREKGLKKQLDFNKFPQHEYTEEELESLFENLEEQ